MKCSACNSDLKPGDEYLQCMVERCSRLYHYLCNNQNLSLEERAAWICPECRCASKKGGNNSEIAVGTPQSARDSNITVRKVSSTNSKSDVPVDFSYIVLEMKDLKERVLEMSHKVTEIFTYVHRCHENIEECKDNLVSLSGKFQSMEADIISYQQCSKQVDPIAPLSNPDGREVTKTYTIRRPKKSQLVSKNSQSASKNSQSASKNSQSASISSQSKSTNKSQIVTSNHPTVGDSSLISSAHPTDEAQVNNDDPVHVDTEPAKDLDLTNSSVPTAPTVTIPPSNNAAAMDASLDSAHSKSNNHRYSAREQIVRTADGPQVCAAPTDELLSNKKRQNSIRCTAGPNITSLKAAEETKSIHLWNMKSGPDEIAEYLQQLYPQAKCVVDELKTKGHYRSYKLIVPIAWYDHILSPEIWPENARIKPWIAFRRFRTNEQDNRFRHTE